VKKYFVVDTASGQKYGPADVSTLNEWIAEGRMNAQSTLEDAETGERIVAHMVAGLSVGPAVPASGSYGEFQSPYPRAGVGGAAFSQYPPGIYFEFITKSWDYIKPNMGMWAVATIVFYVATMAVSMPFSMLAEMVGMGGAMAGGSAQINWGAYIGFQLIGYLVQGAVVVPLSAGMVSMAIEQIDGKPLNIATMFKPFQNFVPNAIGGIAFMFAIILGCLLCIVPGLYVLGRLSFTNILITEQKLSAGEGLKKSWETMAPFAWAMFGFYFVASLLASLGIFACCIGILVTAPILHVSLAQQYRVLFPDKPLATTSP